MRRLAWVLVALTRATKEYEESFAEDLFGNLELYEQAALNGDLTNAEARRARLVEDLDAPARVRFQRPPPLREERGRQPRRVRHRLPEHLGNRGVRGEWQR